jgi:hypothetical protein
MVMRDKINVGERALLCAIIEMAVEDFVSSADDPVARQSEGFKSAYNFLFGDGEIDRALLRDPITGDKLEEDTDKIVGCTLKEIVQTLNVNGQPLNVEYLRQGIKKKLELKRRADAQSTELNRWKE